MKKEIKDQLEHVGWKLKNQLWKVENFLRDKGGYAIDWITEHPTEALGFLAMGVSGLKASQSLVVNHRINKERSRIDKTYYDPSSGFHWSLRRVPTNDDRIEITRRKRAGQEVGEILRDLRLI